MYLIYITHTKLPTRHAVKTAADDTLFPKITMSTFVEDKHTLSVRRVYLL